MSIADSEIDEPTGEPLHDDSEQCRCAECATERLDYWADTEISY